MHGVCGGYMHILYSLLLSYTYYRALDVCVSCLCVPMPRVCVLQVTPVEAGTMLSLYALYVAATFYTSRADEPLHADLALHEFPPEDGGIGEPSPQLTASHRRLPAPDVLSDLPAYLVELYVCGGFPIVLRSSSTPSTAGWVITAVAVLVLVLQTSTTAAARTSTGKSRMSSTPTMSMPPPASVSLTLKPRTQKWTSASGAEPTPSTLQTHQRLARIVQLEAESSASPEEAAAQGPRVAAATGPSRRCCHGGIGAATAA